MNAKEKLIRYFYSYDGLKGLLCSPEETLLSTLSPLKSIGQWLTNVKKEARLNAINKANKDQDKPILISIILPVFNSEKTIVGAVESIQKQSYPHWELLIIDDGSCDDTLKIAKQYLMGDERIKIHKNDINRGVSYSRNIGLTNAGGDYITFHDADDLSHPDRLEYQLSTFLSVPSLAVVTFLYVRINHNEELCTINGKIRMHRLAGMMIRHDLIKKIGYFKPLCISEDTEYYERIISVYGKGKRKMICKVLYKALFSPDSLLFSNANTRIEGNTVNFVVSNAHLEAMKDFRKEHELIASGKLLPYQPFKLDNGLGR